MKMRGYVTLWLVVTVLLAWEYFVSPRFSAWSAFRFLAAKDPNFNLSREAGRPISLFLGWSGVTAMLLTNIYILAKRISWLRPKNLVGWLNFHIFCGLIGPTFIVFHCNFKVGGLVAISFWSMVIVATSGVIGRYIYNEVNRDQHEMARKALMCEERLFALQKATNGMVSDEALAGAKARALSFVGAPARGEGSVKGLLLPVALVQALIGDLRCAFSAPATAMGLPDESRAFLEAYAIAHRHASLLEPLRKLLGYWHTFHLPFAFFMWIAAVLHIIAALLLGVRH